MKPRFRPFSNLYFQYIKGTEFDGVLHWHNVAVALHASGLIELIPNHNGEPEFTGYRETWAMEHADVKHVLREYAAIAGFSGLKP